LSDVLPVTEGMVKYSYQVVAVCDGVRSQAGVSANVVVGSGLIPPFIDDFADGIDDYTVIDGNNDGKKWQLNDGNVRMGYNTDLAMNDWLISPAIKLEAGKIYDVVADIWCQAATMPERIEVMIGKTPTAAGMTTVVLKPTDIAQTAANPYKMSVPVIVDETGEYYIGFHGISDADMYYLNVDNFGLTAPRSGEAPAAASDLKVIPDAAGALLAEISFVSPSKTISGNALSAIDKIELTRNGEVINTWENPATGAALSYSDALTEGGDVLYSVVAYNAEGAGFAAEQSVFVGFDVPAAPENITMTETSTPGVVTVAWDPVTTDANGLSLPASDVTYQVYKLTSSYTREPVSEKITDTTYTFEAVAPGEQDFVTILVFAYNESGEGDGNVAPFAAVGTPYTSFSMTTNADLDTYILGTNSAGGGKWATANDATFQDVTSAEVDGMFFYMTAEYLDDSATLFTGKIDLSAIANPGMTFFCMPLGDDDANTISVEVTDLATGTATEVYNKAVNQTGPEMTWNKQTVDLTAFAGKTVQITVEATAKASAYTLFDGWKLVSLLNYDLAVTGVNAPGKVKAGEAYSVEVTVENVGTKAAAGFSVELYADGKVADTKTVETLAADTKTTVKFDTAFSAIATEAVTYTAKVVYTADENTANNESESVTVTPVVSKYPALTDLTAESAEGGVSLKWNEPDLTSGAAVAITEDFEDGTAASATFGDWIFVDKDNSPVGGFESMDIPGISSGYTTGSFWVWDTDKIDGGEYAESFEAHSGTKYLFALYRADDEKSNEWAISPELDGSAQTISFYAKSYSAQYPEMIQVSYSTGSTDPSGFTVVKTINPVAADWTLYKFDVPAGAKRFAINSCATGAFMLMVDDVTYTPANATADLDIKGYDVYRDGVKINEAPVEECQYLDTNVEDGKSYEYAVVVVYNKGLSASSNVATVLYQASGLESVFGGALTISAVKNNIVITGAEGQAVAVYTVDGKTVFAGKGEAKTVIPAQQGVYVVKAGKTVKKVLVK
ncbi:MAG: choice-of-anchor J domain-containing protein, partial [Duncaniella sp.]|nr:choice-of-anchor J domain-containing protein [Duncaniella sp.]